MKVEDKKELELLKEKASINSKKDNTNAGNSAKTLNKENNQQILDSKKIQKEKNKREKKRRNVNNEFIKEDDLKFEPIISSSSVDGKDDKHSKKIEKKSKKKKEIKEKKPFSWKSLLLKLFICIVISSFVSIILFSYVDRFIYNLEHSNSLEVPIYGLQKEKDILTGVKIDSSMSSIQYSYNAKYFTYLKDGKIYINDLAKGEQTAVIESQNPICYYHLLYDKNLIFYVTKADGAYSTTLKIWTYEFTSKNTSEYNEFNFYGFVRVKDMEYSPVVNLIYLSIERNQNGYIDNVVYKIDLFNNMYRYAYDMIINKMVMLKKLDRIYFQEDDGTIYYQGYPLRIFNEGVELFGLDYNDDVYLINDDRNKIYVLDGRTISRTIELPTPKEGEEESQLISWYSNNTDVYLIYSDYICCISSDKPLEKIAKMSDYMTFVAIKGNKLLLKTSDNRIITTKID